MKYIICILRENNQLIRDIFSYTLFKQKTHSLQQKDLSLESTKILELVISIDNSKDKLKRLKELKTKNDEVRN